MLSLISDTIIQ